MGLTGKAELNGRQGLIVKYDEAKGRVGIEFQRPHGVLAIRPANLIIDPKVRLLPHIWKQQHGCLAESHLVHRMSILCISDGATRMRNTG